MRMAVFASLTLFIAMLLLAGCASQATENGTQGAPNQTQPTGTVTEPPSQPSGNVTPPVSNQSIPLPGNQTPPSQPSGITASVLASHSDYKSCWVLYRGMVYDITDYLFVHPGGAAVIVPTCGKSDSSYATLFEGKHNTTYSESMANVAPIVGKFAG